jgi:hypothetical protein
MKTPERGEVWLVDLGLAARCDLRWSECASGRQRALPGYPGPAHNKLEGFELRGASPGTFFAPRCLRRSGHRNRSPGQTRSAAQLAFI